MNSKLKEKKLYLLDMDGTIYLDDFLFEGVLEFLDHVKKIGGRYLFLTNNSSKGVDKYIEKLGKLGIKADKDDFITSVDATVVHLKGKSYKKIYVLGTESFKKQLRDEGLPVVDELEEGIDCLCMGFDTELTFKKLEDACKLLTGSDIDYIATNPDWVCPTAFGSVPDCGSVSMMLKNATGKWPLFIGKPQTAMVELAIAKTGYKKEEAALMGDRLYTDIACGVNAGISTIFVLSGEGTMKDVEESDKKPEFILKNVKELYDILTDNN